MQPVALTVERAFASTRALLHQVIQTTTVNSGLRCLSVGYFRDGRYHYRLKTPDGDTSASILSGGSISYDTRNHKTPNPALQYASTGASGFSASYFDPAFCLSLNGARRITEGRGTAVMFPAAGRWLFLKSYQRGGMIRHLSANAYLWTGLGRTRAWREFSLLQRMAKLGLAVPNAYACRVEQGAMTYQASLIVEVIESQGSLQQLLKTSGFAALDWRALGEFIGQFGSQRIFHADLNTSNILMHSERGFYLIDFDKSCQFNGVAAPLFKLVYEKRMLKRLLRSLRKSAPLGAHAEFSEAMWQQLMAGYRARTEEKNSASCER